VTHNPLSRRGLFRLGAATVGGALLAGCTPETDTSTGSAPTQSPSAAPSPAPSAAYGTAPLTGLPASAAGIAARPAIVVDLFLDGRAPAPAGLDGADAAFEEVTGRGTRRVMAVYQSRDAARIGPVADSWPSDIRNLPFLHPLVAARGGVQKFSNVLGSTAGLTDVSYPDRAPAYSTQSGAPWPYNLYTSTAALYRLTPAGSAPPPGLLPFQQPGLGLATTGAVAAHQVSVTVPGEPARLWVHDVAARLWRRQGSPVAATNLAILVMPYRWVKLSNHGASIRTAEIFGSGPAWVASGASAVRATWSRKGAFGASLVADPGGFPVRVLAGTTWMFYAPTGTSVTIS
jgi:Protein of unknown function (DUF3048) N-terminal domain/Protein of unknown function (DUF3048) C-terminal domain